jgi:hypothetical protein
MVCSKVVLKSDQVVSNTWCDPFHWRFHFGSNASRRPCFANWSYSKTSPFCFAPFPNWLFHLIVSLEMLNLYICVLCWC